jgi:hypothetical protein
MVNPSSSWPSPDSEGNTFGSVLWTTSQILSLVASGTISITRGPGLGANEAVISVYLYPFMEEEPELGLPYSCIIGAA